MQVTMMLTDYAQVADGKLFISGGGWSVTDSSTPPVTIAMLFAVPWDRASQPLEFTLALKDADGRQVVQSGPEGDVHVAYQGRIETNRPEGLAVGIPIDVPVVLPVPPLQLAPGSRYAWDIEIDGERRDEWHLAFSTRPAA